MFLLVLLSSIVWGLVSLAAILFPFTPFKTRKQALISTVVAIFVVLFSPILLVLFENNDSKQIASVDRIQILEPVKVTALSATAEETYNFKNFDHKVEMVCIAALSLGRDMTHGADNETYADFTNLQNKFILKYAYSKQLNRHVDARKILLKGYDNDFLVNKIEECAEIV